MACSSEFIDFVCSQIADAGMVRAKKMFGDYCIYVDEKPVLLACDNIVYIKKHDAIAELMTDAECGFPYDGCPKEYYILDIDHCKEAVSVIATLLPHLPYPKPRKNNKTINTMKKILAFAFAVLMLIGCKEATLGTTMIWIEDKPGPSVQGTNIFPTVPDSLWEALGLTEGVPSSMSCFLMQTEGEYILFDAGLGAPFSQLLPRLSELGLSPADIPYIYITHMHGDHIGGLIHEGSPVFPNAQLYVNRLEAEAWISMPDGRGAQAQAVLEAYSGRVHLFEAGDVLPLGVKAIAAYGHTPGHTCFEKDSILVIADILHGAALQLEHPEYCPFFDMDPVAAAESRLRILSYAREHGLRMYGHHLPAPGYIE